ncbi:hypothetical protein D5F01_LYC23909 [Larimichthys crocea]|uniref:Endonuclease/exonuclease/phosphatase domain-containing protein n=1 Tax=Larimichthys crocea TaxID=215358 RepID=A0A6G0HFQ7_LARCR|nr:hypothetical protein D5F01_LYC23909 [Larimichthys crocea]
MGSTQTRGVAKCCVLTCSTRCTPFHVTIYYPHLHTGAPPLSPIPQLNSNKIRSIWSTSRHHSRSTTRAVNHSVLAHLARSANTSTCSDSSALNFALLNIRSLTNKGQLIQDIITDNKLDFLCLTETWQQPNDFTQLNESTPAGFVYISQPRASGRGGGLAVIHRGTFSVSPVSVPAFSSFESTVCGLSGPVPTVIATVYRPPKQNSEFLNDFAAFLNHLSSLSPNIIILGDFNIHMDNINLPLTKDFTSCLESFGCQQHITFPTHSKGHILDLICCSGVTPSDLTANELPITDHFLISFTVKLTLSISKQPRLISLRNIKNINPATLTACINSSCLPDIQNLSTPDDLVSHYNTGLLNILNTLAPLKTRTVSFTVSAPWFTPALRLMKAKGRQLERLHRKTGLTIHKEMYKNHMSLYKDSITSTKTHYYSGIITANQGNSKTLFSLLNNITQPQDSLPSHCYTTTFCNSIMSFFTEKIKNIHQQLGSIPHLNISTDWHPPTHPFPTFHLPSLSEIAELIKQSKPSTCQLDPLPTQLVKACSPLPGPPHLCHHSLISHHWNCSNIPQNSYHYPNSKKTWCRPLRFQQLPPHI